MIYYNCNYGIICDPLHPGKPPAKTENAEMRQHTLKKERE